MNKTTILALLMIVAAAVILWMPPRMWAYANFQNEAITSGSRVKVVGVLAREKPMEYNPEK